MGAFRDLTGKVIGRWKVLRQAEREKSDWKIFWVCECQCASKTVRLVQAGNLLRALAGRKEGASTNCGCVRKEKMSGRAIHRESDFKGRKASLTYTSWKDMKDRCSRKKNKQYIDYGGRGIRVCDRWKDSYLNFKADMGERKKGESIERKDVNGHYEPVNCRWATSKEQARNKRNTRYWTHFGIRKSIADWAEEYKMALHVLVSRLRKQKLPFEVAVTRPVAPRYVLHKHKGKMLTRRQIAEMEGVPIEAFSQRMHANGDDVADALLLPFKTK